MIIPVASAALSFIALCSVGVNASTKCADVTVRNDGWYVLDIRFPAYPPKEDCAKIGMDSLIDRKCPRSWQLQEMGGCGFNYLEETIVRKRQRCYRVPVGTQMKLKAWVGRSTTVTVTKNAHFKCKGTTVFGFGCPETARAADEACHNTR